MIRLVARPLGITIICLLGFLNAISMILIGLGLVGVASLAGLTGTVVGSVISGLGITGGLAFLVLGILTFVIVYGLWEMQKWAWSWTIFFEGLAFILSLLSGNVIGVIISGIIVAYLWMNKGLFR